MKKPLFLILIFSILLPISTKPVTPKPRVNKGTLDLRNYNSGEPTEIIGSWFYIEKKFLKSLHETKIFKTINVPGLWKKELKNHLTYGTYYLKILLPDNSRQWSIKMPIIESSYHLFINGKLSASCGKPGTKKENTITCQKLQIVHLKSKIKIAHIMLQVANYHSHTGGLWRTIYIGHRDKIQNKRDLGLALDLFFFGCIFFAGLYHLISFIIHRINVSHLYFSLFCFCIAIRISVLNEHFITLFFQPLKAEDDFIIAFLTFYIPVVIFFIFFQSTYKHYISKYLIWTIQFSGILFSLLSFFQFSANIILMISFQLLTLLGAFFIFLALLREIQKKNKEALIFLIGFMFFLVTMINDFLYYNQLSSYQDLVPSGIFILIISQSTLLSIRYSHAFKSTKKLSIALEQKSIELKEKNNSLIEMDKLKDEFLANTSHELKTPLYGIIGLAESLLDKTDFTNHELNNLHLIIASSKRLSNLVNNILNLVKLRNMEINVNTKSVNLNSTVSLVLDLLTPTIKDKNIFLLNNINKNTHVEADENLLMQILINIIGNAIKFTKEGSIKITTQIKDNFVKTLISDTGIGIAPKDLKRIFNTFEQVDGSLTRAFDGTGLGLPITKELITLQKGTISVDSTLGKGTTFTIVLPEGIENKEIISHNPMADSINKKITQIKLNQITIDKNLEANIKGQVLIVDDDNVNLTVLSDLLNKENYKVTTVQSGKNALEEINSRIFEKDNFDIVLLDLMMPEMSGYDVCKEIRTRFHLFELPVLILTARSGIEELISSFDSGANDYLNKPINKHELVARVETLVTLKNNVSNHKAAEFKLLQKRMSPHFLFNALNSIHSLLIRKPDEADTALIKLANNYRFLMDISMKELIPFNEEWKFLQNYIDLEMIRFGDTINFHINNSGQLNHELIPPLTIQPLVENAIKHGLRNKAEGGTISITTKKKGSIVTISVKDDGVGLNNDDLFSRSLGNINKRLRHHYPDSNVHIEKIDTGGVATTVCFSI